MSKKILLVDDEEDLVKMVVLRLKSAGYSVVSAYDGQDALDKAYKEMPDLIMLDLLLPKMSGYEVCDRIKNGSHCLKIPIIMFTACTQEYDEKLGYKCGADAYVVKPFEPVDLLAKIKELLGE